jgi:hypothetical protein
MSIPTPTLVTPPLYNVLLLDLARPFYTLGTSIIVNTVYTSVDTTNFDADLKNQIVEAVEAGTLAVYGLTASQFKASIENTGEAAVTGLVADLAAKAPVASPTFTGTVTIPGTVALSSSTVGTTAPAAGGAGALPATPLGYVTVNINGTNHQIAYY